MSRSSINSFLLQQLAATESPLLQDNRTYTVCANTTFVVGALDVGSATPVGGGFPLFAVNPNMELICEVPGTCVFTGYAPLLSNSLNITVTNAFLVSQGLPPLPSDFTPDSSELLVQGMTFRNASDATDNSTAAVVELYGSGTDMTFQDCLWEEASASNPPRSALFYMHLNDTAHGSLLLDDCTFRSNTFHYAVIRIDDETKALTATSTGLSMTNVRIHDNNITSKSHETKPTYYVYSGVMVLYNTRGNITDLEVKNNAMVKARGAVVLINSDIEFDDTTFEGNTRSIGLGLQCSHVAHVSLTTDCDGDESYVDMGCGVDYDGTPPPCSASWGAPTRCNTNSWMVLFFSVLLGYFYASA